jgi:hypothetical protein
VDLVKQSDPKMCPGIHCQPKEFLGSSSRAISSDYEEVFAIARYFNVPMFLQPTDIFNAPVETTVNRPCSLVALPSEQMHGKKRPRAGSDDSVVESANV